MATSGGSSESETSEEMVTPMRSPSWSTASTATLCGTNRISARRSSPLVTLESSQSYLKMLTARAATSRMLSAETADSETISIFAQRLSGIASVGLNAIELVKET